MVKLKDLFNKKVNSNNKQISLDIKKKLFKKFDINIDEVLNLEITKKEKRFNKW